MLTDGYRSNTITIMIESYISKLKDYYILGLVTVFSLSAIVLSQKVQAATANTFQVTTYNTLAPTYAGIGGGEWYSHIDPALMLWESRQEALIGRIHSFGSDILCLQEIEPDFFVRLQSELTEYSGIFLNAGGKPGEALFWRHPFELIDSSKVVATDGRFGQIVELQWGDRTVGILNGHFAWDELGVKAHAEIQEFVAQGILTSSRDHWVICGDFNVTRDSPAIKYLESLQFHRAYRGVEPNVTCSVPSAAHEVDFILATPSLKTTWVAPIRPISGPGMLPCIGEPSDHLAKTAIFTVSSNFFPGHSR